MLRDSRAGPYSPPPDPSQETLLNIDIRALTERVREESAFVELLTAEAGKVIVGQRQMLERVLIGLLCNGHVLLEGVPGLAKTLTVRTFADSIAARFQRIQFTPDLLPADLVGTMIYNQQSGAFTVRNGPIFANVILADEINRAPAKVQSALLEAMQERQVTIGEHSYALPSPVHRPRHPEPHRAGGDLPAARGPGGPLHAQGHRRLPHPGRGAGDPRPDGRGAAAPRHAGGHPGADRRAPARSFTRSTWTTR